MKLAFPAVAAVFVVAAASLVSLDACDDGSGSAPASSAGIGNENLPQSAMTTAAPPPTDPTGPTGTPLVSGTCTSSDPAHICLGTKWVTYVDDTGAAVLSQQQALTNLATMNQLWAQCDIGFQIEQYVQVDPTQYGLDFGAQSENELEQIRSTFNDNQTLLSVTTGPWSDAVNAWTALPDGAPYGAVMEQSIVDYGAGIVYAHEFGHYLGLVHVPDTSDLMDAIIYLNSQTLTSDECATARQTAQSFWTNMVR